MENQESWWFNLVPIQGCENQEHQGPKAGDHGCLSSSAETIVTLPGPLCFQALNKLDDAHPHWSQKPKSNYMKQKRGFSISIPARPRLAKYRNMAALDKS